jgi:hypothetical protein
LMLLASYLYSLAGLENKHFNASFRALQPIVAAMVPLPTAPCPLFKNRKHITNI